MTCPGALLFAALTVGTWNGEWFPSGRAEHRAAPEVESRTIADAAAMIDEALALVDPAGTNDLILCFNEMRRGSAGELLRRLHRRDLAIAIESGYRRRDRYDMQQDVIATSLPVVQANWSRWKNAKGETPPRGYAHALVVVSPAVTASVYAVHLKSNYAQKTPADAELNRVKRRRAVEQLIRQEAPARRRPPSNAIIAGDFNADAWRREFAADRIFALLEAAGFANLLSELSPDRRTTYSGRYGGSALDYIIVRGFVAEGLPLVYDSGGLSDHNPVFINLVPVSAGGAR